MKKNAFPNKELNDVDMDRRQGGKEAEGIEGTERKEGTYKLIMQTTGLAASFPRSISVGESSEPTK